MYRTSAAGYAALSETLRNRCVTYLEFDTDQFMPPRKRYSPPGFPGAEMVLWLPYGDAATMRIMLSFPSETEMIVGAYKLVEVIKAAFLSTAAVYGYVSAGATDISADWRNVYGGDEYEIPPRVIRWPAVQRFARGTFWANALGDVICKRLGGQEHVLADAPTSIRQPLGSGVWLQTTLAPPAPKPNIAKLAQYLTPVFDWGEEDMRRTPGPAIPETEPRGLLWWPPLVGDFPESGLKVPAVERLRDIPFRELEDALYDYLCVINIHLATSPTEEQRESVITALIRWYLSVETGGAQWRIFRDIRELVLNGTVIRWTAEIKTHELDDVFRILREELAHVENIEITEVVIGEEIIG